MAHSAAPMNAVRDALSMFDQIAAFSGGNITYKETVKNLNILDSDCYFEITDAFLKGDVPTSLLILNDIIRLGFDAQYFVSGLSEHLRNLLVSKDAVYKKGTYQMKAAGDFIKLAKNYWTSHPYLTEEP